MSFQIGELTVERVAERESWPFPPAEMFPGVTPNLFDGAVLDFAIATYLVRTPTRTVLVDAGNGNAKRRPVLTAHDQFDTDYLDRLRALVDPADIDVVVCTHLHPDHCGGLTHLVDGRWVPTFPRARHLVPRVEMSWLQSLRDTGPHEGPAADLVRTYDDSIEPVAAAGLIDLVDVPVDLGDGITVRLAAGHTPGHVVVELRQGDEFAVVSGDVLHHSFQLEDLSLPHAGDADPASSHRSRQQLVDQLVETGGLLLPCHFGPGHIVRTPTGIAYHPAGGLAQRQLP